KRRGERVQLARVERDTVPSRVTRRRPDCCRIDVHGDDRCETEHRGGDRDDPGATADIENALRFELRDELEAQACCCMRSGPERAPGIDDEGNDVPGRTLP